MLQCKYISHQNANQKIEIFCVYLMKIKLNYSSLQTFIIGLIKISILNAFLSQDILVSKVILNLCKPPRLNNTFVSVCRCYTAPVQQVEM